MILSGPIVIFDLETNLITSKAPFPEILEIGAILLTSTLDELDVFHSYVKPINFDEKSAEIHKITRETLENSKTFPEIWRQFHEFVPKNAYLCSFNLFFDYGVLKSNCSRYNLHSSIGRNVLDLRSVASFVFDYMGMKVKSTSLKNFCERLDIPIVEEHTSLGDVRMSVKLLSRLLEFMV